MIARNRRHKRRRWFINERFDPHAEKSGQVA
jgi:hypothetical protein